MTDEGRPAEFAELARAVEARLPFNRVLGLRLEDLTSKGARLGFDMREDLVGNYERGSLHGGVISSALDVAGGMAALMAGAHDHGVDMIARFKVLGTIDLRVDYLRPGVGEHFSVTAEILRSGRRVAVTRMELRDETEVLVAVGTGTYVVG